MKVLHLLRSEPDDLVRRLIKALSEGKESVETPLFESETDYDSLIENIFDSDQVISWW